MVFTAEEKMIYDMAIDMGYSKEEAMKQVNLFKKENQQVEKMIKEHSAKRNK